MHSFKFTAIRGQAKTLETKYQRAVSDCQRIVRRYYAEHGGLSGYTAHTAIGTYGGLQVNGKRPNDCKAFEIREHFSQNLESYFSGFVNTTRLPYDLVVTACLAVLKHRLGNAIEVSSDGNAEDWIDGVEYARKVTGLKLKNPIATKATVRREIGAKVFSFR